MLFTVVAEFAGGTYISQVRAHDVRAAVVEWARQLDVAVVQGVDQELKAALINDLKQRREDTAPVLLNGLDSAWCTGLLVGGKLMMLNIVQTTPRGDAQAHI